MVRGGLNACLDRVLLVRKIFQTSERRVVINAVDPIEWLRTCPYREGRRVIAGAQIEIREQFTSEDVCPNTRGRFVTPLHCDVIRGIRRSEIKMIGAHVAANRE